MDNLRVDKIVSPQPGNNNSSYLNTKLSDGKKEHSKEQTDNEFKRFLELETKKLDSNKKWWINIFVIFFIFILSIKKYLKKIKKIV